MHQQSTEKNQLPLKDLRKWYLDTPKDERLSYTEVIGQGDYAQQYCEYNNVLSEVRKVSISAGKGINAIQFHYAIGQRSKPLGDISLNPITTWSVPQGEHIDQIHSNDNLDWIQFITDKGTQSPLWGNNSQKNCSKKVITIPKGYKSVGIIGKGLSQTDQKLIKIGFIIAPFGKFD